jgi:Mn2+/Fe2+ NRAMP family transporter
LKLRMFDPDPTSRLERRVAQATSVQGPKTSSAAGRAWRRAALAMGPGLVVMLADTDAGSVVTAAQSGAEWGYRLLALQFAMIPLLFVIQELTVRLAFGTGQGFAELIRSRYGRRVAVAALAMLSVSGFGALVTQLSALGGLAQAFGAPAAPTAAAAAGGLFLLVVAGRGAFRRAELVALTLGLFELAFVVVAWRAGPKAGDISRQMFDAPLRDTRFLYLLAANIGTTFLPWAAFYQQSAILDKPPTREHLREARLETLAGAILCQVITAAILVAGAATARQGGGFASVGALAATFSRTLGGVGKSVFALGLCGSALTAGMVASLAIGWSFSEVFAFPPSHGASTRAAPGFLPAYAAILFAAGAFVAFGADPMAISIAAGAVNAVLTPAVLGLLYALARTELKGALALSPAYGRGLAAAFLILAAISLYAGLRGLLG